jgi:hypothetical protein
MADDTPPEDLVTARRDFIAADAELSALAAEAPSVFAEDGSIVGAEPELAARMNAVRARMQQLALFIAGHDWLGQASNRFAAWKQVDELAKARPQ